MFDMSNGNKDSLGQDMEPSQSRTFSITMDFPGVTDRVVQSKRPMLLLPNDTLEFQVFIVYFFSKELGVTNTFILKR